jgi:hypothetical protein
LFLGGDGGSCLKPFVGEIAIQRHTLDHPLEAMLLKGRG